MKRFGESWGAPICDEYDGAPWTETPVGEKCIRCTGLIIEGDQGIITPYYGGPDEMNGECSYHLHCFLESLGISTRQYVPND